MKIIHLVLGKANPERMNGVNKVAFNLATTQTELGHDVTLWGITGNPVKNYPDRNFKTTLFQSIKSKFSVDQAIEPAIKALPKGAVVHMHGSFITEFYHISKLLKKHKVPYVYTSHGSLGGEAMKQNGIVKQVYFKLLEKTILKNAKSVHLLGASEQDNLAQLMPKCKHTCLIPNGQDIGAIPKIKVNKSGRKAPIFGFLGRLDKNHKGLDYMIGGFAQYIKAGGKGTLELIGDGSDLEELETLAKESGVGELVTFHGARFGEEKFQMTANFDVFLHTSRMEGFPTAVLEAAALYLPCLTSEETNINDYVRKYDAGFPYDNNGVETVSKVLAKAEKAFDAGVLEQKGQNAYKMVIDAFSWESVSKQLVEVYQA